MDGASAARRHISNHAIAIHVYINRPMATSRRRSNQVVGWAIYLPTNPIKQNWWASQLPTLRVTTHGEKPSPPHPKPSLPPMTPNRLLALLTLITTLTFHLWQNHFAAHGGSIALPKTIWLGLTLYCWLLQPPLIIRRSRNPRAQTIWRLFWAIMLIRASAELWLLYGTHQWKYSYGIAHDLLSAALLYIGARHAQRQPCPFVQISDLGIKGYTAAQRARLNTTSNRPTPEIQHMNIIATMFLCEALFAYYISHFNANQPHAQLWFINWQSEHLPNLIFTLACEAILLKWLHRIDQWLNQHD